MALAEGNRADVAIPNALIEKLSPDGSYALITLPDDGSTDGDGKPMRIKLWLPSNDPRVTINQIAPANWPPVEGDLWIVPGISPPAFVVSDGAGTMYFCTADAIRTAYTTIEKVMPPTVEQALTQFGNKLKLLYREAV